MLNLSLQDRVQLQPKNIKDLSETERDRRAPSLLLLKPEDYRSTATSSKFQSCTISLLTARLRTSRGGPTTPLVEIHGCGVTLDVDAREVLAAGCAREIFLIKQFAITEHLPSFSELETE
ncbi:hypothetical protein Vadar_001237 [Vaccinium darrowii]|uniref:Uncharacterized protein n=1 Tax=Vaccinium darrowii TaxID=229202 RepID=A0ACB7Z2U6_9ERIC|nr:hypothetical protein Vadar_001237 [Vaccinium darrowii]